MVAVARRPILCLCGAVIMVQEGFSCRQFYNLIWPYVWAFVPKLQIGTTEGFSVEANQFRAAIFGTAFAREVGNRNRLTWAAAALPPVNTDTVSRKG